MTQEQFIAQFKQITEEMAEIAKSKNSDYSR